MRYGRFLPFVRGCALALAVGIALTAPGAAQDRRQNEPGNFDYYVLSLSWSPSYCEASAERAPSTVTWRCWASK